MATECGISKKEDDTSKPLILNMVERIRVGDYGGPGSANKNNNSIENSQEVSHSPGQMKPQFGVNSQAPID